MGSQCFPGGTTPRNPPRGSLASWVLAVGLVLAAASVLALPGSRAAWFSPLPGARAAWFSRWPGSRAAWFSRCLVLAAGLVLGRLPGAWRWLRGLVLVCLWGIRGTSSSLNVTRAPRRLTVLQPLRRSVCLATRATPGEGVTIATGVASPGLFQDLHNVFSRAALPGVLWGLWVGCGNGKRVLIISAWVFVMAADKTSDDCCSRREQWARATLWAGMGYSVLRNSAMAMASMAAPIAATIARDRPTGTSQPSQVMPGLRTAVARGLSDRWLNTAWRIGATT